MILVDDREIDSGIPDELKRMGVPIKIMRLIVGDYIVTGSQNICVERKEAHDYLSSMSSGRLNNQLVKMSREYGFSIIIVEGKLSDAIEENPSKRHAFLSSQAGCVVKRCPDGKSGTISMIPVENVYDTALTLKFLHNKNHDPRNLVRLPKLNPLHFSDEDYVVGMLCMIPGIGIKLARNLLNEHGNIQNIANASLPELLKVKKVGKKKAENIFNFFRFFIKNK